MGRAPEYTTRFWEIPVPMLVVKHLAGQPLLLAAWLHIAGAEREDMALGQPPRSWEALAASVGLDLPAFRQVVGTLVAAGLVTAEANGWLHIPWTPLYLASLAHARAQRAQPTSAAPPPPAAADAPAAHQASLDLDLA